MIPDDRLRSIHITIARRPRDGVATPSRGLSFGDSADAAAPKLGRTNMQSIFTSDAGGAPTVVMDSGQPLSRLPE